MSLHQVSLPKRERRPAPVESSRSYVNVSSWMRIFTATWSGSHMLRSSMQTGRVKVRTVT